MRVFVTGSSACLAQALLPQLCADPGIEAVTGADLRAPRFAHGKFTALRLDIRDAALAQRIAGHDALINLAFVVLRGRMSEREMFDINVRGSLNLFHAARAAGVRRMVHLSSAAVYGAGVHLDEDAALDPLPGFLYARHKAHLERLLAIEFPDCARLRPHVVLGPNAQPLLKRLLNQPFYLRLPPPYPLLQCVHEDDVAHAALRCLESGAGGAFNLAAEEAFSFREVIRQRQRLSVPLPPFAARAALGLACKAFGWGGEPAWIDGLARTLLVNCRRAAVMLGWRSRYSAQAVLAQV
jgi:nucleoside-diphosphate-sugar epimerase